jgi:uncharacterized Fe-S cluster-containing protein
MTENSNLTLPGLNCGSCGFKTCDELAVKLTSSPDLVKRCIFMDTENVAGGSKDKKVDSKKTAQETFGCIGCGTAAKSSAMKDIVDTNWVDSLGRDFDFYLEHFPEDPGPREIILPHNPMITREIDVKVGDILIGRPLGMSCGCPITHCGIVANVEQRTGVITWCVTGPLGPRSQGYKDLGYYFADGYEGIVHQTKKELRIGERYYFQPRMCMLQWRHSGLLNYLNRNEDGWQVRVEGLFIG